LLSIKLLPNAPHAFTGFGFRPDAFRSGNGIVNDSLPDERFKQNHNFWQPPHITVAGNSFALAKIDCDENRPTQRKSGNPDEFMK
jgi:hypothetical protein